MILCKTTSHDCECMCVCVCVCVCVLNLFNHVYMRTENIIIIAVVLMILLHEIYINRRLQFIVPFYKFTFVLMSSIAVELVHYPQPPCLHH